ncbi:MAG TPA: hypothetical protein VFE13_01155, partial [Caulobacteraceae bacterium]|nr:hypothetical protein [Caulobacteraceae bacterium]
MGTAGPASANPADAIITALTVSTGNTGETHILISFSGTLPEYSLVTNDVDKPVLGFSETALGPGVSAPAGTHGLVTDLQFAQRGAVLNLTLAASAAAHVVANPINGRALDLVVTPVRAAGQGQAAAAAPAAATGGLPKAIDRPPGEDGFEVVFLKYADISEVVGILTDGLSVKSNDSFTPQEPNFGALGGTGATFTPPQTTTDAAATDALAQSVDDAIAVDRRLNAIILKGSPERIARLKEKIALIDVP